MLFLWLTPCFTETTGCARDMSFAWIQSRSFHYVYPQNLTPERAAYDTDKFLRKAALWLRRTF